ncbi:tail fiber domain-containing protein [Flavobacterium tyrosinilyticum]|uniref:tail fiber domain-containing protein n=1 Tax=Flavobacterium tyrosinilyticum TaxID=1658740 RepID=UPI00203056EC|nr:tail fiber domain-containing protein [Flavobacterium tyrosinilyticum]MCM0667684.1 tail fiber domain-containing protein [Flavobacterium tyrosinilyticum]
MKKIICMLVLIQSGIMMAQTKTVVTPYGEKVTFYPSAPGTADNGLTITSGNIQLGGTLIKPSVLTTTAANTLAIPGLQAGAKADEIVTMDANGVLRKIKNNSWDINGNAGTTAGTNFIGTTDSQDLVFKRSGSESGRIGINSTSFGYSAAWNNKGQHTVGIGMSALSGNTGDYVVAIGNNVLKKNSGTNNVGIGNDVLSENTTGGANLGVGTQTLSNNTTGDFNVGLGTQVLVLNTIGRNNVGVGVYALNLNVSGNDNIAIGQALTHSAVSNRNIVMGNSSLQNLTSGNDNIVFGDSAGFSFGNGEGIPFNLTSLNSSILIGNKAFPMLNNDTNEIVIGYKAKGKGSNTVVIGNSDITSIGGYTPWSNYSDSRLKKNIVSSTYGLDFINKLRPVLYNMKTGTTELQSGFIAQEVEAAANSIGYKFSGVVKPQSDTDFYALSYASFVVPLVKAVQEQQTQIESLQKELNDLKAVVQKLIDKK